jgi:osmoprotectant transport system substrate-binding protein
MREVHPRPRSLGLVLAVSLLLAACSAKTTTTASRPPTDRIVVASFDFPESELLAQIYAQALQAKGYPATLQLGVGSREIVEPSLSKGLVQFVAEYAGSALDFFTLGKATSSFDPQVTHAALSRALQTHGLLALAGAPAEDANGIAVTRDTAAQYGLRSVSDLTAVAADLVFGGPDECPDRSYCLIGLRRTYGIEFSEFVPLDAGGPLTLGALRAGLIDAGLVFTTDPSLRGGDLVLLRDDRGLQPAENVTPVVRRDVVDRYGQRFVDVVDAISAALTTEGLRALNAEIGRGDRTIAAVAAGWLRSEGLA